MDSQSESKVPGPGGSGSGGREKRRSFLPAPKRPSAIPPSSAPTVSTDTSVAPVRLQKDSPKEDPVVAEETIPGAENLTVGGRILISGVKPGILRFVGKTSLAPGYWCGIELFDASGLHDGEVDGKRYFTCKSFRGIFAPLDKVAPDESHKSSGPEEDPLKSSETLQEAKRDEEQVVEPVHKPAPVDSEASKIPGPAKSQIARFSGIPRIGQCSQEKGVTKSKSADFKETSSKIAVFCKRSSSGQDASSLNSTFVLEDKQTVKTRRRSEDGDTDSSFNQTFSKNVEKPLKSDSRQYFNITFNKDTLPSSVAIANLPDVVSSASPSPPRETSPRAIPGTLNQTQSAQDIASSLASDMSLGLVEPDIIADDTNLLEGLIPERVAASTSESDVSLSGTSSTLEETSVATVNEAVGAALNSTPLQGVDFKKFLDENGENSSDTISDAENVGSKSVTTVKQNLAQTFTSVVRSEELSQRKDSSSSISGVAAVKADLLQEEGSNGVSPEVSQVLEWDYDHDAFDGKLLLEKCQDGMSTSTSDSCSEASADHGGILAEKGAPDVDMPVPEGEEAHPFEESEDGFENIDNIADFPLGMSKETQHIMTDSGISEKGFLDPVAEAASKRKSVEFDSKVSVVDVPNEGAFDNKVSEVDLPGEVVVERRVTVDENLQKDLMDGHTKQERPLSLISTTSADTGYVPDTDSETGTLTTNSPTEWTEKHLNANLATGMNADTRQRVNISGKSKQAAPIGKGLSGEIVKETETDSDMYSDVDTAVVETASEKALETNDHQKPSCKNDCEQSEDEEEEEEESCEEETSSGEEEEEEEEEELDDDRPEDDRVEADRVGPSGEANPVIQHASRQAVDTIQVPNETIEVNRDMTESANLTEPELPVTEVVADSANTTGSTALEISTQGQESTGETPVQKSETDASEGTDESSKTISPDGGEPGSTRHIPKKKVSPVSSPVDKKVLAEHKKAVKSAHSRLADYIKTPPPSKPKEEKKEKAEPKSKKVNAGDGKTNKTAGKKQDNGSSNVVDKTKANISEEKTEKPAPVKEEKPKVKRTAPKSKWGNIMSQIEAGKDTTKVKPKTEIKSSLAVYLSTPSTANPMKEEEKDNPNEDSHKPKSKLKLVKHSKPDFSNVKSKLNVSSPQKQSSNPREASSPNRSSTPKQFDNPKDSGNPKSNPKESGNPRGSPRDSGNPKGNPDSGNTKGNPKDNPGHSRGVGNLKEKNIKSTLAKKTSISKIKTGKLLVEHRETLDNCSNMSQATSSRTDLSVFDETEGTLSTQAVAPVTHLERKRNALSCAGPRQKNERSSSVASTKSDASAQRSVKSMNIRNAQKLESSSSNISPSKKPTVKSSIPPPNQNRFRNKTGGGLKSGQPPDVVSTSARGSRAQEVARLESLCEARTKELNYTKMQLRASLQAFDAMTCLLNYCTNQLNAFSCPAITAKLKTTEGKLTEQQETIECLNQQKVQLDQQVQEVTVAKEAALQDVARLKQEMAQAEEAHNAAQQQLKEEQAAALKAKEEELASQHEKAVQQMQKCQDKHTEYTRQCHKRQVSELNAEHQLFTNQLKLAHLEEIQELRNKHDQQMEELHAQHRNKLEDITRRFESIKLSLSEKVQSLCVECDELRVRAKTSEEALQRDADVKVQLALAPYLHLPKEIESLKMVIDMRTEEIQKLRRHNMDLEKQLEELPIAQEKVASLQQKVENLQAIINIKTDHEKQLHEKCQVLMRKYDRESRANKRLSMDYEQVMWRMSQSADLTGSMESLGARQLSSSSPSRSEDHHSHASPSPVRRSHSSKSQGEGSPGGVTRRQRKISSGEEDCDRKIRCRSATFSLDKSKSPRSKAETATRANGTSSSPGSPSKHILSKSADYADMIVAAINNDHEESFSSGRDSADMSSMESSMILETAQGVSYNISVVENGSAETGGRASATDDVFTEHPLQLDPSIPTDFFVESADMDPTPEVTVVVNSPSD